MAPFYSLLLFRDGYSLVVLNLSLFAVQIGIGSGKQESQSALVALPFVPV